MWGESLVKHGRGRMCLELSQESSFSSFKYTQKKKKIQNMKGTSSQTDMKHWIQVIKGMDNVGKEETMVRLLSKEKLVS